MESKDQSEPCKMTGKKSLIIDAKEEMRNFGQISVNLPEVEIPEQGITTSVIVGRVKEVEAHFVTGSKYIGTWDSIGMSGVGRYIMPHGVIFEGEFRDGVFHGQGTLEWPQKQRIDGVWHRGELQEKRYTFKDGLVFQEDNWDYCQFPDRRFFHSLKNGPNEKNFKTPKQTNSIISLSSNDTVDDTFNPDIMTCQKSQSIIRISKTEELDWIKQNYCKNLTDCIDYQTNVNRNLSLQSKNLSSNLPLSKNSPQSWWQRLTTFERDVEVKTGNEKPVPRGEDISREIICRDMEKWKNLDLSKTICVPPSGGKISTINIEVSDDETILSLEGKFQGYTSNEEIFDEEMREIERTRVVHDSSHSSLDENKLVDVDDDEQLEKEQINVTEEAEKELLEIMTKTKQREILKDSSKQEIIQMDKENNTKYRDGDLSKRTKEAEKEEGEKSVREMPETEDNGLVFEETENAEDEESEENEKIEINNGIKGNEDKRKASYSLENRSLHHAESVDFEDKLQKKEDNEDKEIIGKDQEDTEKDEEGAEEAKISEKDKEDREKEKEDTGKVKKGTEETEDIGKDKSDNERDKESTEENIDNEKDEEDREKEDTGRNKEGNGENEDNEDKEDTERDKEGNGKDKEDNEEDKQDNEEDKQDNEEDKQDNEEDKEDNEEDKEDTERDKEGNGKDKEDTEIGKEGNEEAKYTEKNKEDIESDKENTGKDKNTEKDKEDTEEDKEKTGKDINSEKDNEDNEKEKEAITKDKKDKEDIENKEDNKKNKISKENTGKEKEDTAKENAERNKEIKDTEKEIEGNKDIDNIENEEKMKIAKIIQKGKFDDSSRQMDLNYELKRKIEKQNTQKFGKLRRNFDFVKKSCDPNLCLKNTNTTKGCVQYSEECSSSCKPKNAFELTHLKRKN